MTDVNIISGVPGQPGASKNSGGILIGLALAGAGLVWYFLTKKTPAASGSETSGGASYGESITGGSGSEGLPAAPAPVDPFQTFTNWWNSLFPAPGAVPAPANTNDAMLATLKDAKTSTTTKATTNAALNLSAAIAAKKASAHQNLTAVQNDAVVNARVNPTKSAGIASVAVPGIVVTDKATGTKVTTGSYDYFSSITGKKYETSKNGNGYISGGSMIGVAGNISAGIKSAEKSALVAISTANKNAVVSKNAVSAAASKEKATKTYAQGGTAYNALAAAMAKGRH